MLPLIVVISPTTVPFNFTPLTVTPSSATAWLPSWTKLVIVEVFNGATLGGFESTTTWYDASMAAFGSTALLFLAAELEASQLQQWVENNI